MVGSKRVATAREHDGILEPQTSARPHSAAGRRSKQDVIDGLKRLAGHGVADRGHG